MVDVDGRLGYLLAYASDTAHCGTRTKSNVAKFGHASKCEVVEGEGRCSNRAGNGERARRQGAPREDTWMTWERAGQSMMGVD
jgi:hypothetical protein